MADTNVRHTCTKADPWSPEKGDRAIHPDARDIGECADGCCDKYECPNCSKVFLVELPQ